MVDENEVAVGDDCGDDDEGDATLSCPPMSCFWQFFHHFCVMSQVHCPATTTHSGATIVAPSAHERYTQADITSNKWEYRGETLT